MSQHKHYMQNKSTVGSTFKEKKKKHIFGCCLYRFLFPFETLFEWEWKTCLGKNNSCMCSLCVPGTWYSCWGFLLSAASSPLHANPATSAFQRCYSSECGSLLFCWEMESDEETWVINSVKFSSPHRGATGCYNQRWDTVVSSTMMLLKNGCIVYFKIIIKSHAANHIWWK